MGKDSIRLSSSEIGGLWSSYLQENLTVCLLTYFLHHNQDEEIRGILQHAYDLAVGHVEKITAIFQKEEFPIPDGFSEKDIDLTIPPLFYDMFGLYFVNSLSRLSMIKIGFITANVARQDVMDLFIEMTKESTELYQMSTTLMQKKGIYDRSPMIPYPKEVEYTKKLSYLSGFGKKRPLNAIEITEIFYGIERNYFSILLCMGLLQVVKDKEIHHFIKEGKKISEQQIRTYNELLMREELLGNVSIRTEVTDLTDNPFSERLIVTLFHLLNGVDITLLGHAISTSMRTDLTACFEKFLMQILVYSAKGVDLMMERGWFQEPPHAPSRRKLEKID